MLAGVVLGKAFGIAGNAFKGEGPLLAKAEMSSMYGTMSNAEARSWYLTQEANIPNMINSDASLKTQAMEAFSLRNEFRTEARSLMADRKAAAALDKTDPNMSWGQVTKKYSDKGFSGDDLYKQIIQSSQKSRQSVNKSLGL